MNVQHREKNETSANYALQCALMLL